MAKRRSNANSDDQKPSKSADSTSLSADEIGKLVENIADHSSPGKKKSNAGGRVREKFTCKCCGARVDTGVHKCSRCIDAGCGFGEKKCKYF